MKKINFLNCNRSSSFRGAGIVLMAMLFLCLSGTSLYAQNVATIGGTGYATLQAAVDYAYANLTGDQTILLTDNTAEHVLVLQKSGLNLTIDGQNKTITGQIVVDGVGHLSNTETLTITNINFVFASDQLTGAWKGADAFVSIPSPKTTGAPWYYGNTGTGDHYNYAHNVTVSNCTMNGAGSSNKIVGVKCPSQGARNITIDNVTISNAHSLAQFTSVDYITITNCTATENMYNGLSVTGGNGPHDVVITGNKITAYNEYGIRVKGAGAKNITIANDTVTALYAIVFGNTTASTASVSSGIYNGTTECITPGSNTDISITGGTFTCDVTPYCASGYVAVPNDPSPGYYTVRMPVVAKIGTTTYPTLQAAVDDASTMTGDVTIEMIDNTAEAVVIKKQSGLNLTIDGKNKTLTGQLIVAGRGLTTEVLTITNFNFAYDASLMETGTGFISFPDTRGTANRWSTNSYNYAHNINVTNCNFDGTGGGATSVAGVAVPSIGGGMSDFTIDHCTAANMHSLAQFTGVDNVTVTNCKAVENMYHGISITTGAGDFIITNDTITVYDDYAIRVKGGGTRNVTLSGDSINGPNAIVMDNSTTSTVLYITDGHYYGNITPSSSDATTYSFTGGTFTEPKSEIDGYCAPNYIGIADDPSAGYCTVRKDIPILFMDSTDVVCFGYNNGTDTVRIQGGVAPFQLVLSSSVLTKNDTVNITGRLHIYTDLKPGSYTVTVTHAGGTEVVTGTFTINEPPVLEITAFDVPQRPCPLMGSGNYDVNVTVQGGNTGAYTYEWGDAAVNVNADATTVVSGNDDRDSTYTVSVTVKDVKNCSATATETFTVSAVIADDGTIHSNSKLTIDTIRQGIETGCDTIIRDFGTPTFTTTIPGGYPEDRLIIVNNIPTQYPDSVFTLGENKIIWTATDTCGHSITGEQVIIIYHYPCPDMTDQDGNVYAAVRLGCDCWTAENLKTTTDNHGNTIENLMAYQSSTHPDANANAAIYGYLYDWNTALDAASGVTVDANGNVQGICPTGWHMPNQEDFMRAAGSSSNTTMSDLRFNNYWLDGGGNNSTGFALLPGGFYNDNSSRYENLLGEAYLWGVNTASPNQPKVFWADCHCYMWQVDDSTPNRGCSIRCVRD